MSKYQGLACLLVPLVNVSPTLAGFSASTIPESQSYLVKGSSSFTEPVISSYQSDQGLQNVALSRESYSGSHVPLGADHPSSELEFGPITNSHGTKESELDNSSSSAPKEVALEPPTHTSKSLAGPGPTKAHMTINSKDYAQSTSNPQQATLVDTSLGHRGQSQQARTSGTSVPPIDILAPGQPRHSNSKNRKEPVKLSLEKRPPNSHLPARNKKHEAKPKPSISHSKKAAVSKTEGDHVTIGISHSAPAPKSSIAHGLPRELSHKENFPPTTTKLMYMIAPPMVTGKNK